MKPEPRSRRLVSLRCVPALLGALLFLGAPGFAQQKPGKVLAKGDALPDWTLRTLKDRSFKVKDQRGKRLVLAFLMQGSGACNAFLPELNDKVWLPRKDKKVMVLGVLARSRGAQVFLKTHKPDFDLAVDNGLRKRFQMKGYPFVVVADERGRILFTSKGVPPNQIARKVCEVLDR